MEFEPTSDFLAMRTPEGIRISMYKNDPGTYYNSSGGEATDELAKSAGFDVKGDRLRQQAARKIQAMTEQSEAELQQKLRALQEEMGITPAQEAVDDGGASAETPTTEDEHGFKVTSKGEIRATPRYMGTHRGSGTWAVINRETAQPVEGMEETDRQSMEAFLLRDKAAWDQEHGADLM